MQLSKQTLKRLEAAVAKWGQAWVGHTAGLSASAISNYTGGAAISRDCHRKLVAFLAGDWERYESMYAKDKGLPVGERPKRGPKGGKS